MSPVPTTLESAIRAELWKIVGESDSMRKAATSLGLAESTVSDFLNEKMGLGPKMLEAVLRRTGKTISEITGTKRETFEGTPIPSSSYRVAGKSMDPQSPPNRTRALALLESRGIERSVLDEELALIAFDAGLSPCEDRPISWWLDSLRERLSARSG
jgi:hypothetical protein